MLLSVQKSCLRKCLSGALMVFGVAGFHASLQAQDFILKEHLGRTWNQELVTFPLTVQQLKVISKGAVLSDEDGRMLPAQLTEVSGQPHVAFQVTLPPNARLSFDFRPGEQAAATDLWVEESGTALRLGNAHIGIELRKELHANEAPIGGLRLRSGAWTAGSVFTGGASITDYRVELLARGPVFAEAICTITFFDRGVWSVRVRVLKDEPVILLSEAFDAPGGGRMLLPLGGNAFHPSHLLYRRGKGQLGQLDAWPITDISTDEKPVTAGSRRPYGLPPPISEHR